MGLEKLVPRALSFLPGGLYITSKKDIKKDIEKTDKKMPKDLINKTSKYSGILYEGLRDVASLIGFTQSIEAGLITYGVASYLLDRVAATTGFIPMN